MNTNLSAFPFLPLLSKAFAPAALLVVSTPLVAGELSPEIRSLSVDLDEAMRIGIGRNFELQSIKARATALNMSVREGWMTYLPGVGLSMERSRAINDGDDDSEATEVRVNIEQVVFDGGQRELNLGLARIEKKLLGHEYRRDTNQLRSEIQRTFLGVLASRGKILLNQKSLERAHEQLRLAKAEERAGFLTRPEVMLGAARVRQIELALMRARNRLSRELYDLKFLMNIDPDIDLQPRGDLFRDFLYDPPRLHVAELERNTRARHPELLRSRAEVFRRRKEKEIAESAWIPRVSVAGYMGREGERFPVRNRTWGVNFAVTFPISGIATASSAGSLDVAGNGTRRGGSALSQVNLLDDPGFSRRRLESRTEYARAVANHRLLENRLRSEVRRGYDDLREAWEAIRIGNGRVYFQTASLKVATDRYVVGQNRRAEILQAEVDLVDAQEQLTDDLVAYLTAAYSLELIGGLDTGDLSLFEYRPGAGNTLLAHLLDKEFRIIEQDRTRLLEKIDPDGDYFQEAEVPSLIDRVEIDETDE